MTPSDSLNENEIIARDIVWPYRPNLNEFTRFDKKDADGLQAYIKEALDKKDALHAEEVAKLKEPTLYDGLCKVIINRIFEAKVNCDPEHDIMLRLESIIRRRDSLESQVTSLSDLIKECELKFAWIRAGASITGPNNLVNLKEIEDTCKEMLSKLRAVTKQIGEE